jgi:hypothetical protein
VQTDARLWRATGFPHPLVLLRRRIDCRHHPIVLFGKRLSARTPSLRIIVIAKSSHWSGWGGSRDQASGTDVTSRSIPKEVPRLAGNSDAPSCSSQSRSSRRSALPRRCEQHGQLGTATEREYLRPPGAPVVGTQLCGPARPAAPRPKGGGARSSRSSRIAAYRPCAVTGRADTVAIGPAALRPLRASGRSASTTLRLAVSRPDVS